MKITFIGLGNMGLPMARRLQDRDEYTVIGYDVSADAMARAREAGLVLAESPGKSVSDADVVISMLPAGEQVIEVWLAAGGLLGEAPDHALLIDCSTIDVSTAQHLHAAAGERPFLDAPVSGGVTGAEAGGLAFMVGGREAAFEQARPLFDIMGRVAFHVGGPGHGNAAKICNNMVFGASLIATCEAFLLGEKFGLDVQKLYEVMAASSGQSWSLTTYCPVPGPVPTSPANRDYQAGFSIAMMLKDMRLSQQAARETGAATPIGAAAEALFTAHQGKNGNDRDCSSIIEMLRKNSRNI